MDTVNYRVLKGAACDYAYYRHTVISCKFCQILGSDVSMVLDFATCEELALLVRSRCNCQTIIVLRQNRYNSFNYILRHEGGHYKDTESG